MTRSTFQPGPLADVAAEAGDEAQAPAAGRWTLVFVRRLRHPPDKVWDALTDPELVRNWAPYTADRNLSTVGDATLTMVDGDTAEDMPCTVLRAERPELLEYTWADDVVRWELSETESGTRLILRHTVDGRDLVPKVAAGWHLCLDVAELLLDGTPVGPIRGQDALRFGWDDLHRAYAERLSIPPGDTDFG
jgi:uncharacterized protein YndB with AHSA1/START domain